MFSNRGQKEGKRWHVPYAKEKKKHPPKYLRTAHTHTQTRRLLLLVLHWMYKARDLQIGSCEHEQGQCSDR